MCFQIDRAHEALSIMVKADLYYGTGARQSESQEQWGQGKDPADFQRRKHDSCKGFRVRMVSDSSPAMRRQGEGSYA